VVIVVGPQPSKGCRVMPHQNSPHLLGDRRLPSIVFAQAMQSASLPQGDLTRLRIVISELIGPEFSLHSFYKRVETNEPHFQ
jgi:hypothetical protein